MLRCKPTTVSNPAAPRWLCLLALVLLLPLDAAAAKIRIRIDSPAAPDQYVYLGRPAKLATDRPIVIVMHDASRNAVQTVDQWLELADRYEFLLVVPEFSKRRFPGDEGYVFGNVYGPKGGARDPSKWGFSAIEAAFDEVRKRFGMSATGYALYGHGAGAQFVHRFLLHVPDARVTRAVAANADWYTLPDFSRGFPYGLQGTPVGPNKLKQALQIPLTVLLGEDDLAPLDPDFRPTPEALAQGANPLARGLSFYEAGRAAAERLNVPFGWRLQTLPGVGHDEAAMAAAAAPILLDLPDKAP